MTDLDLQLIPTDELSKELLRRFDGGIIFAIQKGVKDNISNYYDHYFGDQATLIGLCDLMKDKLKEDYKKNTLAQED